MEKNRSDYLSPLGRFIPNDEIHIHVFVAQRPSISSSELVQKIKNNFSQWVKMHLNNHNFAWQKGYGAFSYSRSQLKDVFKYIKNQQTHHKRQTFEHEYRNFLEKFDVAFEEKCLFEFFD